MACGHHHEGGIHEEGAVYLHLHGVDEGVVCLSLPHGLQAVGVVLILEDVPANELVLQVDKA